MNDSRVDLLLGMITTFPSAVSNFGLLPTLKVLAGTLNSLSRNNITTSSTTKYTLLTFTIYPDLARIWQYYVHKNANISDHIHLMVVDCSGLLDTKIFSSGSLFRFWNYVHSVKIDHFIQKVIKTPYVWLCDDDIFIINPEWMTRCNKFFTLSNQSSVVSFAPRRWSFEIKNQKIPVMGSYCLIFNREVFIREKLSFGCVHSQNKMIGRGTGYYDTGDYANEQLLKRNYDI